jgi:hypothetical protein
MRANYEPLQQSVGPLTSTLTTSNPWLANDCVSTPTGADSLMIPVDCAQPHDGRIVARVTRADDCPPTTDEPRYEPTINSVLCVETTR